MTNIEDFIYIVRGQKVILDEDLAMLYGVETKNLNKAMVRNYKRFPKDFAFRLNKKEYTNLKSQIVTSKSNGEGNLKFQFGTSSLWGGRRKNPIAFTEQGVAMLSGILNSPRAIRVNIEIMRTFIRLRHFLASQKELTKVVLELRSFMLQNSRKTEHEIRRIWQTIEKLIQPPPPQNRIGFNLETK